MTTPNRGNQIQRIVGLFPELLGVGGVHEATDAANLIEFACRRERVTYFLKLNELPGFRYFTLLKVGFPSGVFADPIVDSPFLRPGIRKRMAISESR
jgi:hypothetical protein